jgi:hypothetical protein
MTKRSGRWLLTMVLLTGCGVGAEESVLDMQGMSVVGNRELPKALYIVPWKAPAPVDSELGLSDSLLINQALGPLDRDEFRRSLGYYEALHQTR